MSDQYSIMPHSSATLVFTCDGNSISSNLFGSITKPVHVGQSANAFTMIFIVEFQPAGYYAFSGIPQKEFTNLVFSFDDINYSLNKLIAQRLEMAHSIESFIVEVDKLFFSHLKMELCLEEFFLANQMVVNSGGRLSVKDVAQNVYYSERHLNRLFNKHIGVNIKSFSRLVRINKTLCLLQDPSLSILQVCLKGGFYDVSHFAHDFKSVCGITPLEYRNKMSDFYNQIAKF